MLQVCFEIYREKLCMINQTVHRTRQKHFSDVSSNCINVLCPHSLRGNKPPALLTLGLISTSKYKAFAVFFDDKVVVI